MTHFINLTGSSTLPVESSGRICPNCQSTYINRMQRRLIDRVISIFWPLKRYSCGSCGWIGNIKSDRK